MPELPDIDVYIATLDQTIGGRRLDAVRIRNPFLVRSVEVAPGAAVGHKVSELRRIGKRIAIGFGNDVWFVLHLMIAGRLQWKTRSPVFTGRHQLAALDFDHGSLLLTEAGTKKRASLHVVGSTAELQEHDPGGLEPLQCSYAAFAAQLDRENHTLKRALTTPKLFSGIGNAYSDEILHAARLSPVLLTQNLNDQQRRSLFDAMVTTLTRWRDRLLEEAGGRIPGKVTAFRAGMAVHGRYGEPCPICAEPVQRIRYKDNETNYCARCQNESRLLRDRSLSRLLKQDWPKTLDDL